MEEKKTHHYSVDDVIAETLAKKEHKAADKKIMELREQNGPAPEIIRPSAPEIGPEVVKGPQPLHPEAPELPLQPDPEPGKITRLKEPAGMPENGMPAVPQ